MVDWRRIVPAVLAAHAALQLLDAWTTVSLLGLGGQEANPLARAMMASWGLDGWVATKMILAAGVMLAIPMVGRLQGPDLNATAWTITGLTLFMAVVVLNNTVLLLII